MVTCGLVVWCLAVDLFWRCLLAWLWVVWFPGLRGFAAGLFCGWWIVCDLIWLRDDWFWFYCCVACCVFLRGVIWLL